MKKIIILLSVLATLSSVGCSEINDKVDKYPYILVDKKLLKCERKYLGNGVYLAIYNNNGNIEAVQVTNDSLIFLSNEQYNELTNMQ